VGEMPYSEGFGSITDINLPVDQLNTIETALATKKPVIVVVIAGRPRIITSVYDKCSAVLFAGLPGFEGGQAIAEIISGKVNPSAKMSFNYPYAPNRLLPHNHKATEELLAHSIPNPIALKEFGTGQSYTTFEYSNLILSDSILTSDQDSLVARVTIKNNGTISGKEAVLWFINDEVASITRPVKDLKFYEKKLINTGESVEYTFVIKPKQLSFPDKVNAKILEDGYFTLMVGPLKTRFRLDRP
jgi:beta-glucosidase